MGAQVTVNCALLYLDFEGRSDARSIKMILQHMAPLQVALVHGSKMATESLAEHCRKALAPAPVHAPARGVTVDCSAASAAYKVRLTEELMATVKFKVRPPRLCSLPFHLTGGKSATCPRGVVVSPRPSRHVSGGWWLESIRTSLETLGRDL